jgi:hypothetical protein
MIRKFKQWWSIIPPISAKQAITSHINSPSTKRGNHGIWLKIHVLAWDRHNTVVGLNQFLYFHFIVSIFHCILVNSSTTINSNKIKEFFLEFKFQKSELNKIKKRSLSAKYSDEFENLDARKLIVIKKLKKIIHRKPE